MRDELERQLAASRADTSFTQRLRDRIGRDHHILARLTDADPGAPPKPPARTVSSQVQALPLTVFAGANRYDTDDAHVLHLWTNDGRSFDVIWRRPS